MSGKKGVRFTADSDSEDNSNAEEFDVEVGEKNVTRREDVVDDLTYDLFNLTACSYHPLVWSNDDEKEQVLLQLANRASQLLYKKLHDLPSEASDIGPLCILPTKEVFQLPRAAKIPEPKPETKWEKFARQKGITKKKKDKMVFDEDTEEYRPRFGYKRAKGGLEDMPIVEVKDGEDEFADPWAADRKQKKDRVKQNAKNHMRNLNRAGKISGEKKGFDPERIPGIPIEFSEKKRGKGGVRKALQLAQFSTASMGRFDEMRPGEPERKITGKKRSYRDNISSLSSEKNLMKSQLRIVEDKVQKKAKGVTNSLAPYEGILPDAPSLSFKKAKGRGKNAGKK